MNLTLKTVENNKNHLLLQNFFAISSSQNKQNKNKCKVINKRCTFKKNFL